MKEIILIKWVCPYCDGCWWECDDNELSAIPCVYCGKKINKEFDNTA